MQAVEKPDEVAVAADDLATPTYTRHLVVVVLEHKQTFLLWHQGHNDTLLDAASRSPTR